MYVRGRVKGIKLWSHGGGGASESPMSMGPERSRYATGGGGDAGTTAP